MDMTRIINKRNKADGFDLRPKQYFVGLSAIKIVTYSDTCILTNVAIELLFYIILFSFATVLGLVKYRKSIGSYISAPNGCRIVF